MDPLQKQNEDEQQNAFDILSLPEACELLRCSRTTIYSLIRDGDIPAFRLAKGGNWKFRRSQLEQWLSDREAELTR